MRIVMLLLAVGAIAGSCAQLQLPLPIGSGVPMTCAERLTESSCKDGKSCRWVNDFKRADGTYATAHCTKG